MAKSITGAGNLIEDSHLISFDSALNQLNFSLRTQNQFGVLMSAVQDTNGGIYFGGNLKAATGWHLAIYYFSSDFQDGITREAQQTQLYFVHGSSCDTGTGAPGHPDDSDAPYISHLGLMYSSDTSKYEMFGLT